MEIKGDLKVGSKVTIYVSLPPPGRTPNQHRYPVAVVGCAFHGVLTSTATHLRGLISVADIAQRISLSADDRWVFTADQKKPRLAVIDTKSNMVSSWISLPSVGYGTAPTTDGRWLLVTMPGASQVAVVDLRQMKVVRTVPMGARPVEILLRPDQPIAYISCMGAGEVAVIDLNKWEVSQTIKTAPGADGLAWAQRQ